MLWMLYAIFCLSVGCIYGETPPPTVCLNMIVKNESHVIERCLTSTLPLIDTWVIVDTGSTDGTQEVIRQFFEKQGIKGELFERPWKNFEHNRNEALQLASGKADYVLFMDADDYLDYEPGFELPFLDKDYYHITIYHSGTKYDRIHLINNHLQWSWKGVLHEALIAPPAATSASLPGVRNVFTGEGARSKDPKKYLKDAQILEEAVLKEPDNSRYAFYLAQSYLDAREHAKALEAYEKRVAMGGWDQEVFWSLYQMGHIKEALGKPQGEVIQSYLRAYQYRPSRPEPLYEVMHIYAKAGEYESGYKIGKIGVTIPESRDNLFLQHWIQDYGMLLELSVCAYWTDRFEESQKLCLELLKKDNLSLEIRQLVEANLGFTNAKLAALSIDEELTAQ